MTITHTVMIRLIHPKGSPAEQAFLTDAQQILGGIPGVENLTISRQVCPKSSFDFQLSMEFADMGVHEAYNDHPDHVGFGRERWADEVAEYQEYDLTELDNKTYQ